MGKITYPPPVKLIAGLLSGNLEKLDAVCAALAEEFGPIDLRSEPTPFGHTTYYAPEMGEHLLRQYVSFDTLIPRERLAAVKRRTNELEADMANPATGSRCVNVDPGYVALEQVVLATTKSYDHRTYLGDGIYAELTYRYREGSYQPLEWTYSDYREGSTINFFNTVRQRYRRQLRHPRGEETAPTR